MQRFVSSLAVVAVLSAVVAVSLVGGPAVSPVSAKPGDVAALPTANLQIKVEDRNPWTNLELNNKSENFQFVIVSDRTGGHRPGVFARAVDKINLLQPEFVISVGDLIEGYSEDNTQWALEWAEFQGRVNKLQMPFFYVPGNHDITNAGMDQNWKRKFGRNYYEFVFHNTLFVGLNTEDPPVKDDKEVPFRFSVEQQRWLEDVLAKNANVRWTFFLMHKPAWTYPDDDHTKTGWGRIEQIMGNRNFTVFAGHKHNYARYVRNGRDYIMLATTGGSSKLRGVSDGEFDHVTWVTMKDSPVIANLMLDGIADKDIRTLPEPKPSLKKAVTKAVSK